jgi:hypothetical protein
MGNLCKTRHEILTQEEFGLHLQKDLYMIHLRCINGTFLTSIPQLNKKYS